MDSPSKIAKNCSDNASTRSDRKRNALKDKK